MEENISERNGFMRLMCGVAMTAIGTAHLARDSKGLGFTLVAAGAMKVAEGIFLYCPLTAAINSNVKDAVASSFDEFMDGDSLMQAFNANYQNNTGGGVAQAASQVAGGGVAQAATQVAGAVSNAMSGNNSSQNGSKNQSGKSATNPS